MVTLGLIVGNRTFFPDALAWEGRRRILKVLEEEGLRVITLSPQDTKLGTVCTWEDAKKCAQLFKTYEEELEGILVTLPNFGEERGIADALRLSRLRVPVLVHAFPDDLNALDVARRGDAFCGKISLCNNLNQYGIPFSLTTHHTVAPEEESFRRDLRSFVQACQVVKGFRNLRIGAIGARPGAFQAVRFSEKILEHHGITVETVDLSEIFAAMERVSTQSVREKKAEILAYCGGVGLEEKLTTMASFAVAIEDWIREHELKATAIQCWTSLEENLGVAPCLVMSLLGDKLLPSACEVDVTGALSMHLLSCASQRPSALVDWNNNFGHDLEKCILFHCGNYPRSLMEKMQLHYADVIGTVTGVDNAYGSCRGNLKPGPFSFLRVTSDDTAGVLRAYLGRGEITEDVVHTFGAWGVAHIPHLQELLRFICQRGFEHHVAINLAEVDQGVREALETYLGIEVYRFEGSDRRTFAGGITP